MGGIRYKLYTESGDFVCETDDESKVMQISAALNATQEPPAAEGPELLVPTQITTATEGGEMYDGSESDYQFQGPSEHPEGGDSHTGHRPEHITPPVGSSSSAGEQEDSASDLIEKLKDLEGCNNLLPWQAAIICDAHQALEPGAGGQWTRERPTEGWYWVRLVAQQSHAPFVICSPIAAIVRVHGGVVLDKGDFELLEYEWQGPLEPGEGE